MAANKTKSRSRILLWLVYGVIITAIAGTATFSRYTGSVEGTGTATVAAIDMSVQSLGFETDGLKKPGDTDTLCFDVVNFTGARVSDVTQSYSITVTSTGNLPLSFSLQCKNTGGSGAGINPEAAAISPGAAAAGGLLPHTTATTHQYELTATWPAEANNSNYADEIDLITVTVDSLQEQPG